MLSFDQALARLLGAAQPVGVERVPLAGAGGRVLAEDLVANGPLPPFDFSAMDGYALASRDFDGAGGAHRRGLRTPCAGLYFKHPASGP